MDATVRTPVKVTLTTVVRSELDRQAVLDAVAYALRKLPDLPETLIQCRDPYLQGAIVIYPHVEADLEALERVGLLRTFCAMPADLDVLSERDAIEEFHVFSPPKWVELEEPPMERPKRPLMIRR